ncbi:aquaporin-4 isoform X1 [Choloepus didactylus]|uniref:aquaporin-4 isoform X1 n=1 Tax=Choloepus didactylus TaxID=27675 RepID=UPI00189F48F0|nr:aquaporin-4 isoform X1 [Choloepus didactylus]
MSDRPAARRWGNCGPLCGPLCRREKIMVAFKGVWTQAFWKAVTAEFLAMLLFVLLSLGSTINWGGTENPLPVDMVLISLCFGLSIATMVQCFGHISGGHINPAVTVAMVCTRKISLAKSLFYIAAQCLGAIIGAGILYLVTPPSVVGGLGVTTVHGNLTAGHGLLVELIITFQLVFTIFASCDSKRTDVTGSIALAIGFSVAIGHLFAINYTGASMNPARSFGPAVIMGNWENHWIYWVGPIIGAVLAGGLYEYVFCPDVELKRRFKEAFGKAAQQTKGSYMEVEDNRSQVNEKMPMCSLRCTSPDRGALGGHFSQRLAEPAKPGDYHVGHTGPHQDSQKPPVLCQCL